MRKSDHGLKPVELRRRYVDVAQQVLQAISRGDLAPGSRLPSDRDLAAQTNVSRATAREALLALELTGILDVRHGEGAFVREPGVPLGKQLRSPLDVPPRELIEARAEIEPIVASLTAARIDRRRLTGLQRLLDQAAGLVGNPEQIPEFVRLGLRFHADLAPCCGNSILGGFASQLADIEEHPLWTLVNQQAMRTREAREGQIREHCDVLDAIGRRDPHEASLAMSRHLAALVKLIFGQSSQDVEAGAS